MTPHDAYSITTHVLTMTIVEIIHKKRIKIPLSNEQESKTNDTIIQLSQTFMCDLSSDVNNAPKTNSTRLKYLIRN